jgi:hypothetical protein
MLFAVGILFLVIIDDYLMMAIIIGLVIWDTRKKNLKNGGN